MLSRPPAEARHLRSQPSSPSWRSQRRTPEQGPVTDREAWATASATAGNGRIHATARTIASPSAWTGRRPRNIGISLEGLPRACSTDEAGVPRTADFPVGTPVVALAIRAKREKGLMVARKIWVGFLHGIAQSHVRCCGGRRSLFRWLLASSGR